MAKLTLRALLSLTPIAAFLPAMMGCSSNINPGSGQGEKSREIWFGIALGDPPPGPSNRSGEAEFSPPKPWTAGQYWTDVNGNVANISVRDDALAASPPDSGLPATRLKSENVISAERRAVLLQLLSKLGNPDDGYITADRSEPISVNWKYRNSSANKNDDGEHVFFADTPGGFTISVSSKNPQWVLTPPIPLPRERKPKS